MRLSEAILLGSTMIAPEPMGVLRRAKGRWYGCAYGMALYAIGLRSSQLRHIQAKIQPFNWTTKPGINPDFCACLAYTDPRLQLADWRGYITHIFNNHVMGDATVTLEQLCDWIRTIEPADEPAPAPEVTEREIVSVA